MHGPKNVYLHAMTLKSVLPCLAAALLAASCQIIPQDDLSIDSIYSRFAEVPDDARTKTWWFHGETATTKEGITADLEAFKEAGLGGVVYYDQVHGLAEHALEAMSGEWWEMFKFAAREAKRLDLTFEVNMSNGYACGGPWITPEMAMQKVCASEAVVKGGTHADFDLPTPGNSLTGEICILAFPVGEEFMTEEVVMSPSDTVLDNRNHLLDIPVKTGFTARSFSYSVSRRGKSDNGSMNQPLGSENMLELRGGKGWISAAPGHDNYTPYPPIGTLEASLDGISYFPVCELPNVYQDRGADTKTVSFRPVKANYFRVNIHDWAAGTESGTPKLVLRRIMLSQRARMDNYEVLAGFTSNYVTGDATPAYIPGECVDPSRIIDISRNVSDGHLVWDAPPGADWMVMRFGYEPTGARIKHGRAGLAGLECDKFNPDAVRLHWKNYPQRLLDTLKSIGVPCEGVILDSHEEGCQNWTEGFEDLFEDYRGYGMKEYLPAIMGYVVGSPEKTFKFLGDFRRTIADCFSDRYFGTLQELCSGAGVHFTAEAPGNWQCMVSDGIQSHGRVEKPSGEFWGKHTHGSFDIREAASAAHLYGHRIVSAEAFTDSKFSQSWADLKSLYDYALSYGVNEFACCASAYQPWMDADSISTGGGRQYCFNRKNTLWRVSRRFWDYQARASWLMRQGEPVVDLLVYPGNEVPVKQISSRLPAMPEGYDWDFCTEEALSLLKRRNGRMRMPCGMEYSLLLEEASPIAPERIGEMVVPDLEWHPSERQLVYAISNDAPARHLRADPKDRLNWAHRRTRDADIYFLNNHSRFTYTDTVILRTGYKAAEFWDPETGKRWAMPCSPDAHGHLSVAVRLAPGQSGFIVAREKTACTMIPDQSMGKEYILDGGWTIQFDPLRGGPKEPVTVEYLSDWTLSPDPRIRFYSGPAVYCKTVELHGLEKYILHFQEVHEVAEVSVNGNKVATIWCSPWEADITDYVAEGRNELRITVTNVLTNSLIGESAKPASLRRIYTYPDIASPSDPLVPSGLSGRVWITD